MSAGVGHDVFKMTRVEDGKDGVMVSFKYTQPPPASSMVNWYFALEVKTPNASKVRFIENGKPVCEAAAP
jgi:hypothetical protein